ncbi:hypothetical protein JADG_008349 [Aureobasidium aubasidani]|nr:hypothetical protein JADG_008349 [Aureobasidium pullulans]
MKLKISRPPGYVLAAGMVSLGGFLNGYDTGSIGAVTEMPYFTSSIGELTPFLRGFTVSLIMLTGAFPSFFAGQLADRFGRLAIVAAGALVFAIGAALEGCANKLAMFLVGRALCGIGEGLWISNITVYITEIAPSARRGMLVSMPQFMANAGICVGYFTCYGSVQIESSFSWRAPYIIQAILGLVLATTPFILPQSPRWLLLNGHRDRAIKELKRLDFSAVEAEKDLLGPAAEQQMSFRQPGAVEGLTRLFRKPYRKPALLALYVLGVIQLSGIDGVLYYAPTLFAQAGISAKTSSFLASGLSAILMLAISIPAVLFTDSVSRRTNVITGGSILTFCMFTIGTLYASNSVTPQNPARWLVIVLVFVFGLVYSATWGIVIMHTRSQDEEQVRDHYDRGDDFYSWFLGPRMIYTSGIISEINKEESLEQLQDNKLAIVCQKIALQAGDRMLDLGCGWGTLAKFASAHYGAQVTGITLGRNQTAWGNSGLRSLGVPEEQSRILCMDYRDTPVPKGKYNKITCLEMSEHVGVRHFSTFLSQIHDMLDDDGVFFMQYAGIRKSWQYEDLIWGLFMNKYIFPGADASTPLGWTVDKLEGAGFEIKSIDTIGVHYSATLWRWYRNWMGNREKVEAKYGKRWFRIWEYFLAYSTIISRQGSATCYQITMVKNINSTHRVEGINTQFGLSGALEAAKKAAKAVFPSAKA